MSEQMSARELGKLLAGVISEAFKNDVRKRYTIDEAEVRVTALILADRKATAEKCREAVAKYICMAEYSNLYETFDVVLKEIGK